jgi:hypothetical protein
MKLFYFWHTVAFFFVLFVMKGPAADDTDAPQP